MKGYMEVWYHKDDEAAFERAMGAWGERGTNLLDTGTWFYDAYECADGEYVSIGSLEPQFFAELVERLDLGDIDQNDRSRWPELRDRVAEVFRSRTRAQWCELLEDTDVCFAPVLSLEEASSHPHNVARGTFVEVDGIVQPAPAPRFSRTPGAIQRPPAATGQHTTEVLADWGLSAERIAALEEAGAIRQAG